MLGDTSGTTPLLAWAASAASELSEEPFATTHLEDVAQMPRGRDEVFWLGIGAYGALHRYARSLGYPFQPRVVLLLRPVRRLAYSRIPATPEAYIARLMPEREPPSLDLLRWDTAACWYEGEEFAHELAFDSAWQLPSATQVRYRLFREPLGVELGWEWNRSLEITACVAAAQRPGALAGQDRAPTASSTG